MPGLLRGVARTAVVAGTATAVSNRVSRRQANRWSATGGRAVCPATAVLRTATAVRCSRSASPAAAPDPIAQLKELAQLKEQGILTEASSPRRRRGSSARSPALLRCCSCPAPSDLDAVRLPRRRTQQAAYNRQLQEQFSSTRRVAPAVPAAVERDPVAHLKELAELHQSGAVTEGEFEAAKAKLLAR